MLRDHLCSWADFEEHLAQGPHPECIVVFCGSQYAGNLGSSLRACALLGVKWVCVLGGMEWCFIKTAFRAAQLERPEHASWEVRLVQAPAELPQADALEQLRDRWGFQLVGLTDASGAVPIWSAELAQPKLALVFGKENGGIPSEAEPLLITAATVPQAATGCLNVGHAVAVTLYERRRQKEQGAPAELVGLSAKRRRVGGDTVAENLAVG